MSDRGARPFVIGIGGGSAAGKSVAAEQLAAGLAPLRVRVLNQDRYYRKGEELPQHQAPDGGRAWPDHNHPGSFDFARLREDLRSIADVEVAIVEGILVLHDDALREMMDLKLFIAADADERIVRRIRRNVARGHDLDGICDFYLDSVRYRHAEFCEPTRKYADAIVPGGRYEAEERERALAEVVERVERALGAEAPERSIARGREAME
jgi:uridine kinase